MFFTSFDHVLTEIKVGGRFWGWYEFCCVRPCIQWRLDCCIAAKFVWGRTLMADKHLCSGFKEALVKVCTSNYSLWLISKSWLSLMCMFCCFLGVIIVLANVFITAEAYLCLPGYHIIFCQRIKNPESSFLKISKLHRIKTWWAARSSAVCLFFKQRI